MLLDGVINGDLIRADADAVTLRKAFLDAGKPVAAICQAPWVLAEADVVRGRTTTSCPSLRTDLRNAGATWIEKADSSAGVPDDLDAFTAAIVEQVAANPPRTRTRTDQPASPIVAASRASPSL